MSRSRVKTRLKPKSDEEREQAKPQPLPARPPDRWAVGGVDGDPTVAGPAPATPGRSLPKERRRVICCSGGGIRAAAFALGGMQRLGRRDFSGRSWYEDVDMVVAVSGGAYIAGSFAMVDDSLTKDERERLLPYAPGSPEDTRLRAHTRYLADDPMVLATGVLNILFGLLLNLLPILAGIYVSATLLGWLLFERGMLVPSPDRTTWVVHPGQAWLVAAGTAAVAAVLLSVERIHDVFAAPNRITPRPLSRVAVWLVSLAALVVAGGVLVPLVLSTLAGLRSTVSGVSGTESLAGLSATVLALLGLVKATVGRFRKVLETKSGPASRVGGWLGQRLRSLAPWAGSALAVALLFVAFLVWVGDAADGGVQWRWDGVLMLAAVAGIVAWQALMDVNRNSIHPYYKERLSSAFAVKRTEDGRSALRRPCDKPFSLSTLNMPHAERQDAEGQKRPDRRPLLVVCAAVNTDDPEVVPSGRGCAPFTFSPLLTGITSGTMFDGEEAEVPGGYRRATAKYEQAAGTRLLTLPGAIAVSGAAVSPVMGRATRTSLRLLLTLANVRLGLWLPNPLSDKQFGRCAPRGFWEHLRWQFRQPGIRALLREALTGTSLNGRWVYVTDGGHYENLGLVEALRRGATEIVAFDASGDRPHSWVTFGEAVQTARADLGVEIDLDPSTMRPEDGSDLSPTLAVHGTCTYPNGVVADLWLCKLALPVKADASWDVYAWKAGHSAFPADSTIQQLYGDREFEAYRRLGEVASRQALELIATPAATRAARRRLDGGMPTASSANGRSGVRPPGSATRRG